ncbi:MAG: amidophosphoribosyltransferase [Marinifilaceae bacterium]|jgi:amidophosphoribosyltransferase|nr:amidophosphoribosyltransferase [Marinifilaceae bacterium]
MSDALKHECGIAFIRLLKPLEYYKKKYGTHLWGLQKLYILMEKQRNRGQDGAGIVSLKFNQQPGKKYLDRVRSNGDNPIQDCFNHIYSGFTKVEQENPNDYSDLDWSKSNTPFVGELYIGHLRYGTFGRNSIDYVHPVMRENNWKSRNLALAGNFNLTNVDELFNSLCEKGQHPKDYSDTVTILEKVGYFLDEENQNLYRKFKNEGKTNAEITPLIEENLDVQNILANSSSDWDGGYAVLGTVGHGDAFITRDPWGIRPAYYYQDDEVVIAASERSVIRTAINVTADTIKEIKPGHALIVRRNGEVSEEIVRVPQKRKSCSFERIYFSRGSDEEIYKERKELGKYLTPKIVKAINGELRNAVYSFIPNTAETAFYGMIEGVTEYMGQKQKEMIKTTKSEWTDELVDQLLSFRPRVEKIAIKDAKLRTFITDDTGRDDIVAHVYDVTYGTVKEDDNLVIIDDSIVRGTTLKKSIIRILDRLKPKKIVVVSSAPQIRYPDCYGIDMTRMGEFIAFNAAVELLKERNMTHILDTVYKQCKEQENLPKEEIVNCVKGVYAPFTEEEISLKISEMITSDGINSEVEVVYQSVEDLHRACPENLGDWYFTGDYPTPGGNKVVNTSFINYMEGNSKRSY